MKAEIRNRETQAILFLMGLALVFAVVRSFLGYGYDDDTYRMLNTWQEMVGRGVYHASRFQGNIVAEFLIGGAAWIGGSVLSNLSVLACSVGGLFFTWKIATLLNVEKPLLVLCLAATNAYFLIGSSTSIDYMVGYAFFVAGLYFFLRGMWLQACVLFAIASGARLSYVGAAFVVAVAWQLANRRYRREDFLWTAQFCAFVFFVSGIFYLPVWIAHGLRFDWLTAATPDYQGIFGLIARFGYKTVYLFGPVGTVLAAGYLAVRVYRSGLTASDATDDRHKAIVLSLSIILFHLAFFARIPVEISYLIPIIPFLGILLCAMGHRAVVWVLIAGNLFANCVDIQLLKFSYWMAGPCGPAHAVGARFMPHIEAGLLLDQLENFSDQDKCNRDELLAYPYKSMWSRLPVKPVDGGPTDGGGE